MTHSELIDALGGTVAVSSHLKVSPSTVSNWRERGVPWRWRSKMEVWARGRGVRVPDFFLEPEPKEAVSG